MIEFVVGRVGEASTSPNSVFFSSIICTSGLDTGLTTYRLSVMRLEKITVVTRGFWAAIAGVVGFLSEYSIHIEGMENVTAPRDTLMSPLHSLVRRT